MDVKKDIVIVNEFTIKKGEKGSRGSSPGNYVINYMMRKDATEVLNPVEPLKGIDSKGNIFDYAMEYMLREEASEEPISMRFKMRNDISDSSKTEKEMVYKFKDNERLSGIGFSGEKLSLSDGEARKTAKKIQEMYDKGQTVQKIVISFSDDFLLETGILSQAWVDEGAGSKRGFTDQFKLREAVRQGVNNMTSKGGYKNPIFMGSIQYDTKHLHCHLVLTDESMDMKRKSVDGNLRGKLSDEDKSRIRRGIVLQLKYLRNYKMLHKSIDLERRNLVTFIKDFTERRIDRSGSLQLLLASLPENKNWWRARSNRKVMRRPNSIANDIIDYVFQNYPVSSGYNKIMRDIESYAKERAKTDGLNRREQEKFVKNGINLMRERAINGIYSFLKTISPDRYEVRTSMINLAAKDMEELLPDISEEKEFDPVMFEIRVRGYYARRNYHKKKALEFKKYIDEFRVSDYSEDSVSVLDFYKTEMDYHMKVAEKYHHFLNFRTGNEEADIEETKFSFERMKGFQEEINLQERFLNNIPPLFDMNDVNDVDLFVLENYGLKNGSWYYDDNLREVITDEIARKKEKLEKIREDYLLLCFSKNLSCNSDDEDIFVAPHEGTIFKFEDVKALDMHSLDFDFPFGTKVTDKNIQNFIDQLRKRVNAYNGMVRYVTGTEQENNFQDVGKDIKDMLKFASEIKKSKNIEPTKFEKSDNYNRNLKTTRVDELPSIIDVTTEIVNNIELEETLDI